MESTTSTPGKPFNIAIIGGGIAGLTLTIALLKHNIPITLYESASKFGEIGAGVGFDAHAVKAMGLISPGIKEGFRKCATTNQWESKRYMWFTVRVGDKRKLDENGFVKGVERKVRLGEPIFEVPTRVGEKGGVHRAHFLDELVQLVPDSVPKFGKKLVNIKEADDGDAILEFADGTTAKHTAAIGCDGIKSRTRELLLDKEEAKPVFSGKCAYRGLIPMERAVELLGEEEARNSQMYVGYDGHVLTFPIAKGNIMNVVAFTSRSEWTDANWVLQTSKEEMLRAYLEWGPTVTKIISAVQNPDIWALFNHRPASTFFKTHPRICLLGDAAHASTPHQGSGAGMCIGDCHVLSTLIAEAHSAKDLNHAFDVYNRVRRGRTLKLVETSREAGMLYEFQGPEGDDLAAIEQNMKSRMAWIWDGDIESEALDAKEVFKRESERWRGHSSNL